MLFSLAIHKALVRTKADLQENEHLNEAYGGYAVFATVDRGDTASFDTVDKIAKTIAENEGHRVLIKSVRLVE